MPKKANQLKTISELTPKQRKFVDIYVSNYGEISKVEAAKQAGFTSTNKYGPTDQASRLLNPDKNPHIVRYFEKRMAQELEKEEKSEADVNDEQRSDEISTAVLDKTSNSKTNADVQPKSDDALA